MRVTAKQRMRKSLNQIHIFLYASDGGIFMCGIIGYSGTKDSVPIIIEGLRTLEYRGYDSAGISVCTDNGIKTVKSRGRLSVLEDKLKQNESVEGHCGVGHTRWATHGEPSDVNSHPHSTANLTLVHRHKPFRPPRSGRKGPHPRTRCLPEWRRWAHSA